MSANNLPESVNAWRMVGAQRILSGSLPLAQLQRLGSLLAGDEGEVTYTLEFGRDEGGIAFVRVIAEASVPLLCQRSLEVYQQPLEVSQSLGLISREQDEAAMPGEYEPLLVESDTIQPRDLIEDELILALPTVPRRPGPARDWIEFSDDDGDGEPNPFQALDRLKEN